MRYGKAVLAKAINHHPPPNGNALAFLIQQSPLLAFRSLAIRCLAPFLGPKRVPGTEFRRLESKNRVPGTLLGTFRAMLANVQH